MVHWRALWRPIFKMQLSWGNYQPEIFSSVEVKYDIDDNTSAGVTGTFITLESLSFTV